MEIVYNFFGDRMVFLRKAEEKDIPLLYCSVNKNFVEKEFCNDLSKKEDYYRWYLDRITSDNSLIFIIEDENEVFLGFVKFEISKKTTEVMIFIVEEKRQKGIAYEALEKGLKENFNNRKIIAKILEENLASIRLFEKLGFQYKGIKNEYLIYEKDC